jgi:hypothetical protein
MEGSDSKRYCAAISVPGLIFWKRNKEQMMEAIWRGGLSAAFLGTLLIFLWKPVNAGDVSIQGRIVDETGMPVGQAPVTVHGTGGEGVAITNQTGEFAFYNLPSGSYTVSPLNAPAVQKPAVIEEPGGSLLPWLRSPPPPVAVGEIVVPSAGPTM